MDVVERYLRLGLRLGRHVDGLVDFAYGPAAELRATVDAEERIAPTSLAEEAEALLTDLDASDLAAQRRAWLVELAGGLRAYAGVLAAEPIGYAEEVERCYGVRPAHVDEAVFAAAHARLDGLLPGAGPLGERLERWRETQAVPPERLRDASDGLTTLLRERTRALVGLPEGEELDVDFVGGEPWLAYNYYVGGLRSRVAFNVDLPFYAGELVDTLAHEAYPGHHTEHAWKERTLVDERGYAEEAAAFVPTAAAIVSEGVAEVARDLVADPETAAAAEALLRDLGIPYDAGESRAIASAREALGAVSGNAALLLHEHGATVDEARAYLVRWALMAEPRAERAVAFLTDPTWRAYVSTYTVGRRLCRAWTGGDASRFRQLLTEQLTVADLLAASV